MSKTGWTILGGIVGLAIGGYLMSKRENEIREFVSKINKSEPTHISPKNDDIKNYISMENKCIHDDHVQNILYKFPKRGNIILTDINATIKKNINVPHMIHLVNMLINLGLTTDIPETDYLKLEREILNNQTV